MERLMETTERAYSLQLRYSVNVANNEYEKEKHARVDTGFKRQYLVIILVPRNFD